MLIFFIIYKSKIHSQKFNAHARHYEKKAKIPICDVIFFQNIFDVKKNKALNNEIR